MAFDYASWLFAGLAAASTSYSLGVIWAVRRYRSQPSGARGAGLPPISLLKPLSGADPELYENLLSHVRQEYPEFEIVCGSADPDDPARAVVERLVRENPGVAVSFQGVATTPGGNPKVAVLEGLASRARHGLLVVNDADIRVSPDYLRTLASELSADKVGLVTCLYRAEAAGGAASLLDALWITTEFPGQALMSRALQGVKFGLGATLALRRADLEAIGGFAAIRPYLADDYQIGARIAAAGKRVRISALPVETVVGRVGWGQLWERHLRWSRTIRASRPAGHVGLVVTFGGVWAAGCALLEPTLLPLALACCVARAAAAATTSRCALRSELWTRAWLAPALDWWAVGVWLASFTSRKVRWRGRILGLDGRGRIIEIDE